MTSPIRAIAPAATLLLALAACGSDAGSDTGADDRPAAAPSSSASGSTAPADDMTDDMTDEMTDGGDASGMAPGAYVDYDDYQGDMASYENSHVVLFFHASWCPDCQATDASLTEDGVPDGLTIVKVDYDSMTDLKQEYGITVQHTFVEVGADGAALKKWTGTTTGEDIAAEVA